MLDYCSQFPVHLTEVIDKEIRVFTSASIHGGPRPEVHALLERLLGTRSSNSGTHRIAGRSGHHAVVGRSGPG